MLQHEAPSLSAINYVEWFHRKFRCPYPMAQWSTIKNDHTAIINCVELYDLRTFLEIGTWKGYTALLVYLHNRIERVKCIDIHKDMDVAFEHGYHGLGPKEEYGTFFKDTFVDLVFADTMKYARGCETHDFIFIDGAHDYEHVKNDTLLAISMDPKVIMWHDYMTIGNDGVQQLIAELEIAGSRLVHYPGSICVIARPQEVKLEKA